MMDRDVTILKSKGQFSLHAWLHWFTGCWHLTEEICEIPMGHDLDRRPITRTVWGAECCKCHKRGDARWHSVSDLH